MVVRLAIVSDIHANAAALRAVLADLRRVGVDQSLCLGDLVGYNTQPRETLRLLRDCGVPSVHGNHDLMTVGRLPLGLGGPIAQAAVRWTRGVLSDDERAYLDGLPGVLRGADGIGAVHSALDDCVVRLESDGQFVEQRHVWRAVDRGCCLCLTGHTHIPGVVAVAADGGVTRPRGRRLRLDPDAFYFVNPGSVGQPRDDDDRAAYAILDLEARRLEFRRVAYDRAAVERDNARHGLSVDLGPPVPGTWAGRTLAAARRLRRRLAGVAP